MKLSSDYIVMRDKQNGHFLNELKNKRSSLATQADFVVLEIMKKKKL